MPRTVIVVSSYDPGYLRIAEHLAARALTAGNTATVLDISAASATPVDGFHRPTLRLFGLKFPGHDLIPRLSDLGATVITIHDLLHIAPEVALTPDQEAALEVSIQSALITYYRTETPDLRKTRVRCTRARLDIEGRSVFRALTHLLRTHPDVGEVDLPNGRFPHQKMAELAARNFPVQTMHYEKGETPDGAYLQPYAPQSRIASQDSVGPVLSGLTTAEVEAIADAWLARRAPAPDSRNEFAALWSDNLPNWFDHPGTDRTKIAGFFTSSQDEFQSLGPEWQLHSWTDQMQAFDRMMTRLEADSFHCFLRVHPNLATKAHDSFLREKRNIRWLAERHPHLLVIWHDDFANTYALLDKADVAVVWDSTVGLEASARGLPVWTMATSRYGLTADIREILSPHELASADLQPWTVNPYDAKRFIAYLVQRDVQMATPIVPWEPWATQNEPIGAKLSRIAVSGGNPSVGAAVLSLLDVYRHRRLRSNLRSILHR